MPTVSACVVQLAWPEAFSDTVAHNVSTPSAMKLTVPVGVPALPLTVAVKVRLELTAAGFVPAVRANDVVAAPATTLKGALAPLLSKSPE